MAGDEEKCRVDGTEQVRGIRTNGGKRRVRRTELERQVEQVEEIRLRLEAR